MTARPSRVIWSDHALAGVEAVEAAEVLGHEVDVRDVARLALAAGDGAGDLGGFLVRTGRRRASGPWCP
jgi:hypothetical protein